MRREMPATSGFNHVAIITADLDRLKDFYAAAFGGEVTFEMAAEGDHPRMAIIDLGGGAALNAFEVDGSTIIGDRRTQGGRGPIDHFALAVDEVVAVLPGSRRHGARSVLLGGSRVRLMSHGLT